MRDAWDGPVFRYFIIALLLVPLIYTIILALFIETSRESLTTTAAVLCAIYTPPLVLVLLARRQFMELWSSDRRFVDIKFQEARPRLEAALASSGMPHREAATSTPSENARFEVGRGLVVVLLRGKDRGKSVIYVSPVNDLTRRDVDGLKRSIDAAFPPAR